jgi:hypothetical protein
MIIRLGNLDGILLIFCVEYLIEKSWKRYWQRYFLRSSNKVQKPHDTKVENLTKIILGTSNAIIWEQKITIYTNA